jgi:hypothetical protein
MKFYSLIAFLVLLIVPSLSSAQDMVFKNLKLGSLLQTRVQLLKTGTEASLESNRAQINKVLQTKVTKSFAKNEDKLYLNPIGSRLELPEGLIAKDNTLFEIILKYIGPRYKNIGTTESNNILQRKEEFNLGDKDFSGIKWQKPMGHFSISANRQIAPDLFSDKYIVDDTFTIIMNASTYLHNLEEIGVININRTQLAAFAGVEFKRSYRYTHMADTYKEGLTSNFDKLFLSYTLFRSKSLLEMKPYEYLAKSDYLSAKAGGYVYIPANAYLSLAAGIMVKKDRLAEVNIQALGPDDQKSPGELYRVSFQKEEEKQVSAEAQLQIEFFNILKLTLLSYEYSYSLSDNDETFLSFYEKDKAALKNKKSELSKSLRKLYQFRKPALETLLPYIVSKKERRKETKSSKYSFLNLGKLKKMATEETVIIKNGRKNHFFSHEWEKVKYAKGSLKYILDSIWHSIFKMPLKSEYQSSQTTRFKMEYKPIIYQDGFDTKNSSINGTQNLSLDFEYIFDALETKKKIATKAVSFLKSYTDLGDEIADKISTKQLLAPFEIRSKIRISNDALIQLNSLSKEVALSVFQEICSHKNSKRSSCYNKLKKSYSKYRDYLADWGQISLWKLRDFLINFTSFANSKDDFETLFNKKSIFSSGQINAMTVDDTIFTSYFKKGDFTGLGLIDNFMRKGQLIVPYSVSD